MIMLFQTTLVQIGVITLWEDAIVVDPSFVRLIVDLNVLLKVTAGRKLLLTNMTLKRLFARVNPLMSDQVRNLAKCYRTSRMFTFEWLLLIMHSFVLLQRRILCKVLITIWTVIGSVYLMCSFVFF